VRFSQREDGAYRYAGGGLLCGCVMCRARCAARLLDCDNVPKEIRILRDAFNAWRVNQQQKIESDELTRYVNSVVDKGPGNQSEAARMISEEYWARVANMILVGRTCA
jgi:hypothetical protein